MKIRAIVGVASLAGAFSALALGFSAGPAEAQVQYTEGHYHQGDLGDRYLLIEQSLRCNCSCGLDVHSCQFQMQCDVSPGWSARIRRELEAGRDVDAIKAGFVADYGATVLMAPPAEGFNLVGYLLPSMAIVVAGMFVGLVVRRGALGVEKPAPIVDLSDADAERLAAALRKLDQDESPDW